METNTANHSPELHAVSIVKKRYFIIGPILLLMVAVVGLLFGLLFVWQTIRDVVVNLNEALCELRLKLTP